MICSVDLNVYFNDRPILKTQPGYFDIELRKYIWTNISSGIWNILTNVLGKNTPEYLF